MKNVFNLPEKHWILAKNREDRVTKLIICGYDMRNITDICRVSSQYVIEIAAKIGSPVRDRPCSSLKEFLEPRNFLIVRYPEETRSDSTARNQM